MLTPGTRVGPYEVLSPLGAGGMGEVYRARDTTLGREVALKTLPAAFASEPERLARLRREARLLASLNHPGIATLHGLEEAGGGLPVLVMELVEGEPLSERLRRGAPSLKEALRLGHEIATALAAAHERGILHRDLKPANVRLAGDGRVKLLDFGLARALEGEGAGLASHASTEDSPGTREGQVVGTAPYMSPEQARGEALDRRTDVWAFGCVLYELLSGKRAFPGRTFSEASAAVLEREPDWEALAAATPPAVRKLLRRCLEKDAKRRLHDIADAGLELEDIRTEIDSDAKAMVPVPARAGGAPKWAWAGALITAAALGATITSLLLRSPRDATPTIKRLTLTPTADIALSGHYASLQHLALSHDGRRVAFVAGRPGKGAAIFIQAIDEIEAHALPHTEGAWTPFFSPDGTWLAFEQKGQLRKLRLDSGDAPVAIADNPIPGGSLRGASWGPDGTIVFCPGPGDGRRSTPALSVRKPASGEPSEGSRRSGSS